MEPRLRWPNVMKAWSGISILAVVAVVLSGCAALMGATDDGEKPPEAVPTSGTAVDIPEDAKAFIDAWDDRYPDALATYYSHAAYLRANPGLDLTIGQDYFTGYDFENPEINPVSPLGFDILTTTFSQEVAAQQLVDVFNKSVPEMNLLMNILAKNPLPDQVNVVKDEFIDHTGYYNSHAQQLVDTLARVVEAYGSSSVFTINEATPDIDADPATATVLYGDSPVIDNINDEGLVDSFSDLLEISIAIETYNASGAKVVSTEIVEEVQFSVAHAASVDFLNKGFIGIGSK
ncbi:hypothetical protein FB472_1210 [Rhodoglobus vestalii]|uniref:Uncharacterized protein n=1 Tax=Rhodoglobus vestalii TaxID=193384 RepID=A0A8H2PTS7_9MICO|nr:hypothetical protein [Rhodoglobus vestalii]TQO19641.1 hypothetical protein FB472_1210 [Rhodoglobus vestalii]